MGDKSNLYIVDKRVLPEVFVKVVEAKRLMQLDSAKTIQDAVNAVGISRSAFYKYRDYVFTLDDNSRGTTVTIAFNLDNIPGLLSNMLNVMAGERVNILTINQTIPINNIANVTITAEINNMAGELADLVQKLKNINGVKALKIIARE